MAKLIDIEIGSEVTYAIFGWPVARKVQVGQLGYVEIFGWKAVLWVGQVKRICGVHFNAS